MAMPPILSSGVGVVAGTATAQAARASEDTNEDASRMIVVLLGGREIVAADRHLHRGPPLYIALANAKRPG